MSELLTVSERIYHHRAHIYLGAVEQIRSLWRQTAGCCEVRLYARETTQTVAGIIEAAIEQRESPWIEVMPNRSNASRHIRWESVPFADMSSIIGWATGNLSLAPIPEQVEFRSLALRMEFFLNDPRFDREGVKTKTAPRKYRDRFGVETMTRIVKFPVWVYPL